jgi:AcrR family transcriptional regulator
MTNATQRGHSKRQTAPKTGNSSEVDDSPSTADRILCALVDVILEGGLPGFSVQQVADRAGVSHRTVYRHFPTREALLEGLSDAVGRRMDARGGMDVPRDLADVPRAVVSNFALFSRDARAVEAGVRFGVGTALETRDRKRRNKRFRELVKSCVRGIADGDAAMAGGVLRQIASTRTWLALREGGLSDEAAARAATWATSVLLDALRAGRTPASETLPAVGKGGAQ